MSDRQPGVRHAIPYAVPSARCTCRRVDACGGIVPDVDCPEHGDRQPPAMEWHWDVDCPPWGGS